MKSLKSNLVVLGSVGLSFLGACSSNNQVPNSSSSPVSSTSETATKTETPSVNNHPDKNQGGQVIESGPYHLEFVPEKEANGTHMDFYLQKGDNHEAISNAKVIAQVQLPDGSQKSLPLTYDTEGKHYTAVLPGTATGEYKVAILTDMSGKKVNGRFTFTR